MGSLSIWHWLIVLVIALLLFGRGKIPELMGDFAKGIKNFKKGMQDDEAKADTPPPPASTVPPKTIENHPTDSRATSEDKSKAV
ncbi:twin-arginine translocase TatA/TatE family subunit [Prosthecodimorpha staleyi]|uniref:Sec-independent protein translocase protein TatA n=1 Tax=Prosthecodimorpha staleyi TaxID=2840188 RepID=A0A947GD67_9HYPH|nr:twin-arginine translocase TatA/TatE family subunit [Prosthecodimorpha staleyi]MBT9292203.1 twin-arginine translocase TatA/TatE family subunit [Prosthecodimorpha staleyi]